ncbi:MAG: response regulator [Verrucomicrobia bacterium]|nr:response regulator [Verrucomicrobiota bacterium]
MTEHTVVLVDDEPHVLSALGRLLRGENYALSTTTHPTEVIDVIRRTPVSLIVSDYEMPELNGIELLKTVKAISPETIRIILTGKADMTATVQAINEGEVFRFITKPWDDEELKITIRHALMQYDLWTENRQLVRTVQAQQNALREIEDQYPGITKGAELQRGGHDVYVIDERELPGTMDELVMKYFPAQRAGTR